MGEKRKRECRICIAFKRCKCLAGYEVTSESRTLKNGQNVTTYRPADGCERPKNRKDIARLLNGKAQKEKRVEVCYSCGHKRLVFEYGVDAKKLLSDLKCEACGRMFYVDK